MNATAREYEPQGSSNYSDQYQNQADTDHLRKLMRRDIAGFYNRLSVTGKRILAALIQSGPTMDEPFPFVVSSLQHGVKCSKLSVLRTLPKGEKAGLFLRENHESGRRHGSIITLYKERCEFFLSLYKQEYGLLLDTDHDRYQAQDVTNADRYQINFGNRLVQNAEPAQSLNLADNIDILFSRLSDQGKRVFGIISALSEQTEQDEISLVIQSIARDAACSEVTARRVIKQGHEAEIYTKRTHERGPRFGIILKLNSGPMGRMKELLQAFPVQDVTNADRYQHGVTEHDRYHDRNDTNLDTKHDRYPVTNGILATKQGIIPCQSRAEGNSVPQPDTNADQYQNPVLLDRQIKNLSGSEESEEERWARRLLSISTDEFQILWPRLHEERFGPDQIRQIAQHRLSFDETILDIENSLHAAEWELEHDTFPEARKGPCNYLFATLKSKGTWRRPVGFLTPNEQALANAKREKAVIRELQELDKKKSKEAEQAARDEKFEAWLAELTPEELQEIDALCSMPISTEATKRSWRKSYWTKNINRNAA
ncbi:hypothetical protein [Maridesulfovibrio salexigens]|uniref:Uncharacterized protein n=1 Tax=Maridesulfovibrio salexigens (strain ATCC 14822 / DSM 2638 / NCIMB 8403 / VKM B-1763) TaxID=526222 RepID=C6BT44_MARSD|nr:hypothetical protein [Maridesulfovibrio salexigens]ACS79748.1 hypothetical protein Desal_1686 [Maridesulfovibrio salexigens DSM 2638]